jgi:hypothetical protein
MGKNDAGLSRAIGRYTLLGAVPLVPLGTVIVKDGGVATR